MGPREWEGAPRPQTPRQLKASAGCKRPAAVRRHRAARLGRPACPATSRRRPRHSLCSQRARARRITRRRRRRRIRCRLEGRESTPTSVAEAARLPCASLRGRRASTHARRPKPRHHAAAADTHPLLQRTQDPGGPARGCAAPAPPLPHPSAPCAHLGLQPVDGRRCPLPQPNPRPGARTHRAAATRSVVAPPPPRPHPCAHLGLERVDGRRRRHLERLQHAVDRAPRRRDPLAARRDLVGRQVEARRLLRRAVHRRLELLDLRV